MINIFDTDPLQGEPSRGERAKQALMEAGLVEFGERGLEGARTRQIAERSGQNLAALHYYFGSKEGLYCAILEAAGHYLKARLSDMFNQIDALLEDEVTDAATCKDWLIHLLIGILDAGIANEKTLPISRIVLREQMTPTGNFDPLYEAFFRPFHERVTLLTAFIKGGDPQDPLIIARAHGLIGQVFIFRLGRELILRRTGWQEMGPEKIEIIREAIKMNLKDWLN